MRKTKQSEWYKGFQNGYFCALAALIRSHGCDTAAVDLWNMAGNDISNADPHDLELFKEVGLISISGEKQSHAFAEYYDKGLTRQERSE